MTDHVQKKKFFQVTMKNIRQQFSSKEISMKIVKNGDGYHMVVNYFKHGLKNQAIKDLIECLTDGVENVSLSNFVYSVNGFHHKEKRCIKISFWEEKNLTHKNVVISYPGQYYFSPEKPDEVISKQMKQFQGLAVGSGIGFGYRDVSFLVPNVQIPHVKQHIKNLVAEQTKISSNKFKVQIYEA